MYHLVFWNLNYCMTAAGLVDVITFMYIGRTEG